MTIYEQGDVLLFKETIPENIIEENGRFILAYGEHTGHCHRLIDEYPETENLSKSLDKKTKNFIVFKDPKSNVIYLRVFKDTPLKHEEHKEFKIPIGDYRIGQVREKDMYSDMIAPVID